MSRAAYTFASGAFAGLAYTHVGYALAVQRGWVNEPIIRGRTWGIGLIWTEAVVYSAISVALGMRGRRRERAESPVPQSPR